eukprot:CAMPEP_0173359518 /NCGR_PEP_ID=MMETSP1144-20121109/20085_1 /TAXON_ID=483371 /ORGANISM="non described non described, Strain CCMP2298" /LENGTH=289 /DNA_ID=CAMNT_0014308787 /DNA_START=37 /DNA_END=903 /DNA_ORIENTATION=+
MDASVDAGDAELIEAVREFWFGGDQRTNYRLKWFPDIASGQQSKMDTHIFASFDKLLEDGIAEKLNHWQGTRSGCVALIVLLDQFSRHIHRHKGAHLSTVALQQERADTLALSVATDFHEKGSAVGLSTAEFVFSLMPLRHTATVERLNMVLQRLGEKEAFEEHSNELMSRFRKQTTRRLQHLQDRAKLEATEGILEHGAFAADESDILRHPLVRSTEAFLRTHLRTHLQHVPVHLQAPASVPPGVILLSLSGGVDSMVLSKILQVLLLHKGASLRLGRVLCMHLDYAN